MPMVLPHGYDTAVDAGGPTTRGRGELVRVVLTAIAATGLVVALYYVLPVQPPHQSPLLRTAVGVAAFVVVLAVEERGGKGRDAEQRLTRGDLPKPLADRGEAGAQRAQLQRHDLQQLAPAQRLEHDDLVDAVAELRPERLAQRPLGARLQ